jgi:hypothetical protein
MSNTITLRELATLTGYSRATILRHRSANILRIASAIRRIPGIGLRVDLDAAERYVAAARPRKSIERKKADSVVWKFDVVGGGELPRKHLMRLDDPRVAECGTRGLMMSSADVFNACRHCRSRAAQRGVQYD